jgi:hypothetical protein
VAGRMIIDEQVIISKAYPSSNFLLPEFAANVRVRPYCATAGFSRALIPE